MRNLLAAVSLLALSACGGGTSLGSLDPLGWFGAGPSGNAARAGLAPGGGYGRIADRRPAIQRITSAAIDRAAGGIILRATGLAAGAGYYRAELVPVASDRPGILVLEFRARPPEVPVPLVAAAQRNLTAARFLTDRQAGGLRQIRIIATENSRSLRP